MWKNVLLIQVQVKYQILARRFFVSVTKQTRQWIWSFLTKIRDENVTNFASFSVNSLASFCKWSCCGSGNDSANQHSLQTPNLCCHSRWHTFVSPWSFCKTLSWRARLLIIHTRMFISSSSPSYSLQQAAWPCCCPWTDAEAPFDFFHQSPTLLGFDRETFSGCFSRLFLCIFFTTESLNYKSYFLFFCCTGAMAIISVIITDRKQHNT